MALDHGGNIRVKLSDGTVFVLRGTFNVMASRRSVEAVTNQDGSVDRTATPMAARAEVTLADRGGNYETLMKARADYTFIEDDNGVTHYFTNAFLSGEPSVNRLTGEVTGLTVNSDRYSRVNP